MLTIIRQYFESHYFALANTWLRMKRMPLTAILSISLIAISLSLPGTLLVVLGNAQSVLSKLDRPALISVYLTPRLASDTVTKIKSEILAMDGVEQTHLISAEDAFTQFEQQSEMQGSLSLFDDNPFPAVIEVSAQADYASGVSLNTLLVNLQQLRYVDRVETNIIWLQRLDGLVNFVQTLAWLLAVLFTMVVVLVISNIIRTEIDSRSEEIEVQELLGATGTFIRRPFLYSGLAYGLIGGIGAGIFIIVASSLIHSRLQNLSELYSIGWLEELNYFIIISNSVAAALAICLLGTWVPLLNYRKNIKRT